MPERHAPLGVFAMIWIMKVTQKQFGPVWPPPGIRSTACRSLAVSREPCLGLGARVSGVLRRILRALGTTLKR